MAKCFYDYENKCDCSEDDKCGCTYPENMAHNFCCEEAEPAPVDLRALPSEIRLKQTSAQPPVPIAASISAVAEKAE